jgi:3-dehydroquinate synthase
MQQIQVSLAERSYPIFIGTNTLEDLAVKLTSQATPWSHAAIIADVHISDSIASRIRKNLETVGKRTTSIVIPSGEESKSVAMLSRIWEQMMHGRTDRKSLVFAIGGGVVGDLAGFAASSYMRGLRFVQVPTTLLAMVDSSVGGKTGINLPEAKNMIGAFWQPDAVWIDTQSLDSLPEREYRSGLAEVVKYGVILDQKFFEYLEENAAAIIARSPEHVQAIVRRSCELKAQVVSQDERETTGLRAILNYGHTFGHAIEATTSYGKYLHGEAIAIGMTMAGRLACRMGLWSDIHYSRQSALLQTLGLPIALEEFTGEQLLAAMQRDKKTENGMLNFILPTKIGHVQTVSGCAPSDILASLSSR